MTPDLKTRRKREKKGGDNKWEKEDKKERKEVWEKNVSLCGPRAIPVWYEKGFGENIIRNTLRQPQPMTDLYAGKTRQNTDLREKMSNRMYHISYLVYVITVYMYAFFNTTYRYAYSF